MLKDSRNEVFRDAFFKEIGCTNLIALIQSEELSTLQLINQICENSSACRRDMCTAGLLPVLKKLSSK